MELFKLLGKIAVDTSEANESIEGTSSKATKLSETFNKVGTKVSDVGTKLSKKITVGAVAAGGAIVAFANKTAATTDTIDKMSQKIGISRQAYQELDFICSQSGTSVDGLQAGMKTLTNQMQSAADGGSTAKAAFESLGLSIYDSNGQLKDQETMLWESLSALQNMENQTEKAALATDLFGRSGSELMPLLNGAAGSIEEMKQQAHDLGLVISDEAVDNGVVFTDTLDQLKRSFSAAGTACGAVLLPLLTKLAQWVINDGLPKFQSFMEKISGLINWFGNLSTGTQKVIGILAALLVGVGPVLVIVGKIITKVGNLIKIGSKIISFGSKIISVIAGLNPVTIAIVAGIAAVIAIGVLLYKNWDKIKEMAGKLKDYVLEKFEKMKDSVKAIFTKVKDAIFNPIQSAKEKVQGIVETIKGFFSNLKLSFPNIKLPHFSVKPSGWKIGDLLKGTIPKLGIDWFAKGGIMTKPTVFGINGNNAMVGGEAGAEAIAPIDTLQQYVATAVAEQNGVLVEALNKILAAILSLDGNMYDNLKNALVGTTFEMNHREFARLVRAVE